MNSETFKKILAKQIRMIVFLLFIPLIFTGTFAYVSSEWKTCGDRNEVVSDDGYTMCLSYDRKRVDYQDRVIPEVFSISAIILNFALYPLYLIFLLLRWAFKTK